MRYRPYLLLFLFLHATAFSLNAFEWKNDYAYFLSVRRNEGAMVGSKSSYTTLEALSFPFTNQHIWPYVDLRYHGFGESGQNAANFGLGFRAAPNCTEYILGANIYYDFRKIHHRSFNQIGLGIEMLGPIWNFRINGYLPVGNKTIFRSSKLISSYSRGYFLIREKYADSLRGINFEAEALLMRICCRDIYFAFGGYFYDGVKCNGNILGSEYRLTASPCNGTTLNLIATHDCRYKTRVQGQIVFTFPFKSCCVNPAYQPVQRYEMIVLDKHKRWIWNW